MTSKVICRIISRPSQVQDNTDTLIALFDMAHSPQAEDDDDDCTKTRASLREEDREKVRERKRMGEIAGKPRELVVMVGVYPGDRRSHSCTRPMSNVFFRFRDRTKSAAPAHSVKPHVPDLSHRYQP